MYCIFHNSERAENIEQLLADAKFKENMAKADKEPLIVAGDFNCPSHLDYIEETKDLHHGWVVEWPATKMLADAGLTDSYRELYPNVTQNPGKYGA
jgi:endonuclease/exonuclease/phosphatase family metal-dependent hydrolase